MPFELEINKAERFLEELCQLSQGIIRLNCCHDDGAPKCSCMAIITKETDGSFSLHTNVEGVQLKFRQMSFRTPEDFISLEEEGLRVLAVRKDNRCLVLLSKLS